MADYGGMWGWQTDFFEDGTYDYYGMACDLEVYISNDVESAKISSILAKKIFEWQDYFERNYDGYKSDKENINFNKDCWNQTGERLTKLLKKQIGHLYDEVYYHPYK